MPRAGEKWDIVGFGVAAVDDVFYMNTFPAPGEKTLFDRYMRVGGGQTATAFVAASRLGSRCFYAGHFGENDLSRMVQGIFDREGIGRREAIEHPAALPTHTLVLVQTTSGERSNVANLSGVRPADIGDWETNLIAGAGCLFVDQSIPECQVAAAKVARRHGVPVVADLENIATEATRELYRLIDHIILPLHVAVRELGALGPEDAVRTMLRDAPRVVACVTDGDRGAWYASAGSPAEILRQPAVAMPRIVDTNGCGDVFHGAYADALVRGIPLSERMRRAATAAAIKTQKPGGQTGAPTAEELETFLGGCAEGV